VMRCSESIDGKYYLVEDFAKECFTEEHNWYIGFGAAQRTASTPSSRTAEHTARLGAW